MLMTTVLLGMACAAPPPADPDLKPLHPPKVRIAPTPAPESLTFTRTSMYDRWQYMAVDRSGHFRPRVVLDDPCPYYLHDGKPYSWLGIRPLDIIPVIFD